MAVSKGNSHDQMQLKIRKSAYRYFRSAENLKLVDIGELNKDLVIKV